MPEMIRELTVDDLEACLDLADGRNWGREERKWRFLLEGGEGYGITTPAGELAATTVLTRYGLRTAAISMVLVAERYGRQGLGGRLVSHVAERADGATVFLNATAMGRPLYERLGFRATAAVAMHLGVFTGRAAGVSRPATPGDLKEIADLDAEVMGADRSALLTRYAAFAEELRVIDDGRKITGYAGRWRNVNNTVIGPVVAADLAGARALIADLASRTEGPVRVEVEEDRAELAAWLDDHGMPAGMRTSDMVLGGGPLPGDRSRFFAPVMSALG
ncbi:GNAT family N-acetyltransferase [Planomonospora sp. ID67723]|uniref:GNAT family N-acetyltransferase n=1 Tax=Planomonospora sp. ID67723 TaxID=2738134 RepID=UPI0018C3A2FC|nr:GNAT family N-acetyltransferase [Planomonospora sp. ID67723]MBG0833015.1 GNAT family N-acetyltransferase [Planomonospora sp. ID67723]